MFLRKRKYRLKELILTGIIMALGLLLLKFLPMKIFREDILFDASMHITIACFILYGLYLFIKDVYLKFGYFVFALAVLIIISFQRIIINAHNDTGLIIGLVLSLVSILIPRWKEVKKHLII